MQVLVLFNQLNVDASISIGFKSSYFYNDSYNRLSLLSECNLLFSNTYFLLVLA